METNKEYLARLLPQLKKEIPSQWRVQSFSKKKPVATVMSYIDQRDLMDVLDAYCEYGWEKEYEEVAGNVFCRIGIHMPDGTVHWRSDCGVESNQDAEKGRASDAAKRAGVNWGVGRFLYDKPIQYIDTDGIKADADKTEGDKVYKRFPNVIDKTGRIIWDLTAHINALTPNAPEPPKAAPAPNPVDYAQELRNAHTLTSLANTWAAIPKQHQPAHLATKDEMKQILEQVEILGQIKTLLKLEAYIAEFEKGEHKDNAKLKALIEKRKLDLTPKAQ